jgi:hypothetical protein
VAGQGERGGHQRREQDGADDAVDQCYQTRCPSRAVVAGQRPGQGDGQREQAGRAEQDQRDVDRPAGTEAELADRVPPGAVAGAGGALDQNADDEGDRGKQSAVQQWSGEHDGALPAV